MTRGCDNGGLAVEPLQDAADRLALAVDGLVAAVEVGGLDHLDALGLVDLLQQVERIRNRIPLVDHAVLTACADRKTAETLNQSSLARLLVSTLRLSIGEASRRVRAAEALASRSTMTGDTLEPRRPTLAAAQRVGEVTPEQVHLIQRALDRVDRPGFDPADVATGEALLVTHAKTFEPKVLGQLATLVVDAIDPDGTLPQEQLSRDRRNLSLRPTRDGDYVGEFRLTGVLGAKLSAVLRPLARPRTEKIPSPDGGELPVTLSSSDERTHGQRMHDALEDVCDRVLRSGGLPDSGGTPATVIVTLTLENLLDGLGSGLTSDGTLLTIPQVLELAEQADIIPTVVNRAGAVLSQGRARRIATPTQTWALIARDGGCSFPGCDRPPELCQRHHLVPWVAGGLTDLDNLTLLCPYHHREFAGRGWTVAMDAERLPAWTPPRWIDREQRPLHNTRIQLARLSRELAAERAQPPLLDQRVLVPV